MSRRLGASLLLAVAAAAVVLLLSGGEGRQRAPFERSRAAPADEARPATRRLSDERTRSRFAFVRAATVARRHPRPDAARVARVRVRTEDRTPEVVLALEQTGPWVRVRLPARPNGTTGWVRRRALGRFHVVTTALRIDRRRRRATLYDGGRAVWAARVAVGTRAAPTPPGRFYVRSRILPTRPGGTYGVYAFGTNGFSPGASDWPGGGVVGVHGTDRPDQIPGRVSHGCVRLRNRDIARLRALMPLGTPILIA